MTQTIIVAGYGPGISDAVAKKFGSEGFSVALVARNQERIDAGVRKLEASGIKAAGFVADLSVPTSVKGMVESVKGKLGAVSVLHWNAYGGGAGDLTTAEPAELHAVFDLSVVGLVIAVQGLLPDLKTGKNPAVLVTGGGLSHYAPAVDKMATEWNAMGLAIAKAAQHKTVGLLSAKLGPAGIYVGEVVVQGIVKGTAFDSGNGVLEPSAIADQFWSLCSQRTTLSVSIG